MKTKVILLSIAFALLFFGIAILGYSGWQLFFPRKNYDLQKTTVQIKGATFKTEIADTALARSRGLSGRDSIGEDEAMLFLFSSAGKQGFWMKDMNFAIDIVFIRNFEVVDIKRNVPAPAPGTGSLSLPVYYPQVPADAVLEFASGTAKRIGVIKGDKVSYEVPQK